jgi:catechol 1,2-dioxygenase
MKRKEFIISSAITAFSMSAFGSVFRHINGTWQGDCETTNDILGPFYRPDAPLRNDLTFEGLQGTRITIIGQVFGPDCVTPLPNAQVEIWHCDSTGTYDNDTDEYRHRARILTNDKGEYSFHTIVPGKYLNGRLYRPSHIHYRVTEKRSKELISQIYFDGDPHIKTDPWASDKKAEHRILPIVPKDIQGNLAVLFDIYLAEKAISKNP